MESERPVTRFSGVPWSAAERRHSKERLALALAISLYLHGLLALLRFGLPGLGVPDLAWPWVERRVQAPRDLTVRLAEAPRPPPPRSDPDAPKLKLDRRLRLGGFDVQAPRKAQPERSQPRRVAKARAPAGQARAPERRVAPAPAPPLLTQSDPQAETFKVPAPQIAEAAPQRAPETAAQPTPPAPDAEQIAQQQADEEAARKRAEDAARADAERLAQRRAEEDARKRAEAEAARLAEARARQQAEEQAQQRALAEAEQQAKALEEARRLEQAKQEELRKEETAKRLALEAEALRRAEEAAREQAARKREMEAQRQAEEAAARAKEAAERQRAEADAAAQRERLAGERAPPAGPGTLSGKELAAKAIDQLRSSRVAPPAPPAPPPRAENPRRRSLFGVERDVSLRMYVDSWRWKIERTGTLNYRPSAGWRARENPVVTVSIRSDGTLEDVLINRSSGVRELDEAIRRIARLNAPYSAFPPDLARQYDVIEIRRVWFFDQTLKIMDEM